MPKAIVYNTYILRRVHTSKVETIQSNARQTRKQLGDATRLSIVDANIVRLYVLQERRGREIFVHHCQTDTKAGMQRE
jgi:hypothetical protein